MTQDLFDRALSEKEADIRIQSNMKRLKSKVVKESSLCGGGFQPGRAYVMTRGYKQ